MFTKLHDRNIPNVGVDVRVGVGPVEFQLCRAGAASVNGLLLTQRHCIQGRRTVAEIHNEIRACTHR